MVNDTRYPIFLSLSCRLEKRFSSPASSSKAYLRRLADESHDDEKPAPIVNGVADDDENSNNGMCGLVSVRDTKAECVYSTFCIEFGVASFSIHLTCCIDFGASNSFSLPHPPNLYNSQLLTFPPPLFLSQIHTFR